MQFRAYIVFPPRIKPSAQIVCMLKMAASCSRLMSLELTLDHLFEIRKQNGMEETEEPEPEPKERTVTVLKLTAGHGPAHVGIQVSEDSDLNEQQKLDKEL
jgi:hypothetical protein